MLRIKKIKERVGVNEIEMLQCAARDIYVFMDREVLGTLRQTVGNTVRDIVRDE